MYGKVLFPRDHRLSVCRAFTRSLSRYKGVLIDEYTFFIHSVCVLYNHLSKVFILIRHPLGQQKIRCPVRDSLFYWERFWNFIKGLVYFLLAGLVCLSTCKTLISSPPPFEAYRSNLDQLSYDVALFRSNVCPIFTPVYNYVIAVLIQMFGTIPVSSPSFIFCTSTIERDWGKKKWGLSVKGNGVWSNGSTNLFF